MQVLSSLSGIPFYAPSAGFAPTNSADVSAIASAYQVVSSTATQLYAGTAYVTSVNDNPLSASRAGNAANASMANSAYYDGTGRLISALPDSATVSAIASSYAESAVSSKQDTLTFGYNTADQISSIDGSALGGMDEAAVSGIASAYAESAVSSVSSNYYTTANESGFLTAQAQASWSESASASPSYIQDKPDLVDIVAGPGIVVDNPDGNTLRVSVAQAEEVVLYSDASGSTTPTLDETLFNFYRCRVTYMGLALIPIEVSFDVVSGTNTYNLVGAYFRSDSNNFVQFQCTTLTLSNGGSSAAFSNGRRLWLPGNSSDTQTIKCTKIVGIHRIAGGN